ncbi:MAG TPA: TetR/AcrR family transcriptional regulator [Nocardioidaceae bacterium]
MAGRRTELAVQAEGDGIDGLGKTEAVDIVDQRREQMLAAAAELIVERGFSETRIADVARRIGTSPALVIYYFGTKDDLLTAALRHSEDRFYTACAEMLASTPALRDRLEKLVRLTCVPEGENEMSGAWGLWFDLWAQAFRHPLVATDRVELERRWRSTIAGVVADGIEAGEIEPVDADDFAVTWAVLLDGLSIQVALNDPIVDPNRAFEIAMSFAERALALPPKRRPAKKTAARASRRKTAHF